MSTHYFTAEDISCQNNLFMVCDGLMACGSVHLCGVWVRECLSVRVCIAMVTNWGNVVIWNAAYTNLAYPCARWRTWHSTCSGYRCCSIGLSPSTRSSCFGFRTDSAFLQNTMISIDALSRPRKGYVCVQSTPLR